MTNYSKVSVNILAMIGVLIVVGLILYYAAILIKQYIKPPDDDDEWPSDNYMEKIGSKCPSGWLYMGKTNQWPYKNICKNIYDVPVCDKNKEYTSTNSSYDSGKCYDNKRSKTKKFIPIKNWDKYKDNRGWRNRIARKERCEWIKQCGPPPTVEGVSGCDNSPGATWLGIDEYC